MADSSKTPAAKDGAGGDDDADKDGDDALSGGGSDDNNANKIVNAFLVYKSQAISFLKHGQFERAVHAFTTALDDKTPQDKETLVLRGQCHLHLNNLPAALRDVEVALDQDGKYIHALYWKAEVLFHQSEFEDALIYFHRGRKQRPDEDRFRLGAQKTEQAILACLEQSGSVQLRADGKLDLFYKSIPDAARAKNKQQTAAAANAAGGGRGGGLPDEPRGLHHELRGSEINELEQVQQQVDRLGTGTTGEKQASNKQQLLHRRRHKSTAAAAADADAQQQTAAAEQPQLPSTKKKRNTKRQSDKLRARVLGDLNQDRKLVEKILDDGVYKLPLNETFRPHNDNIERECTAVLDFLDQRQAFWLQRNPFLIINGKKTGDGNDDGAAKETGVDIVVNS